MKQWVMVAVLISPVNGWGQTPPPPTEFSPMRVGWQLVDFLVMRPAGDRVRILSAPNLRSSVGGRSPVLDLEFDRIQVLQWATFAQHAAERVTRTPQTDSLVVLTPLLPGNAGRAFIVLSRAPRRQRDAFVLSVRDSNSPGVGWNALAQAADVTDLLNAMLAAATAEVSFPGRATADSQVVTESELDRPPSLRGKLPAAHYPQGEGRNSGRVWVQYVVSAEGWAEMNELKILLSDGPGFSEAARQLLARAEFEPGTVGGNPVRVLVFQVFNFVRD